MDATTTLPHPTVTETAPLNASHNTNASHSLDTWYKSRSSRMRRSYYGLKPSWRSKNKSVLDGAKCDSDVWTIMRDSTVSADSATPSSAAASDVTQDTEAIKASDTLLSNATVKIRRARKYEGGQVEVLHQGICSKGEFNRCELRFEHGAVVLQVISSQTYQFEWEYEPAQENPAIKITMRQKRRATYRRGIHCKTIYTYPLAFTVTLSKRYTSGPNPLSSLRPLTCDVYNKGKHIKRDFIVTYNNKRTFHVLKPLPEQWILNDEGVVYQLESLETDVLSQPSVTKEKSQRWWFSRRRRPHTPSGVEGRKGVQGAEQIVKHGEESDSFTDAGTRDHPEQHGAETSETLTETPG